jgi:hypothetical protein
MVFVQDVMTLSRGLRAVLDRAYFGCGQHVKDLPCLSVPETDEDASLTVYVPRENAAEDNLALRTLLLNLESTGTNALIFLTE